MILKELKLNNFISHENTHIVFGEDEKLLLDGRSGSGKSAITEAILWALYGRGRSDGRSLVRRGTKAATVQLRLTEAELETIITRSVSTAGKNTLTVTQNTGTKRSFLPIKRVGLKDIQEWIENTFLGASYELFTNSVAYPQENENSFVKATASRRKDLLMEIVRAGNFDEMYEKTRRQISIRDIEIASSVAKIDVFEQRIRDNVDISKSHDIYKKSIDESGVKMDALVLQERLYQTQLTDITAKAQLIAHQKATLAMAEAAVASLGRDIAAHTKLAEDYSALDTVKAEADMKTVGILKGEAALLEKQVKEGVEIQNKRNAHLANRPNVFDYSKDLDTIKAQLVPLEKDLGKCPAGDDCPFIVPIKGQVEFLKRQMEEKVKRSREERGAMEEWEKVRISLTPVNDTNELYKRLNELNSRIWTLENDAKRVIDLAESFKVGYTAYLEREGQLTKELEKMSATVQSTKASVSELERELAGLDANALNSCIAETRIELRAVQKRHQEASTMYTMALKAQALIAEAQEAVEGLKKGVGKAHGEMADLELLKEALSPRGIKAVVVDYLVPQLEERINTVLGQMSDFRVRLDTQAPTADEGGVKEGLFITVINDKGEELPFASYSGGEKVKITVAISEALASLMNQIGFRIMDENIVSLDSESTEGFIDVLVRLQVKFPQLVAISHLQEVKDIFEKRILVTKRDGVSVIQ